VPYPALITAAGLAMIDPRIRDYVHQEIRAHEIRVAIWSGMFGLIFTAGTWHAIWMCR